MTKSTDWPYSGVTEEVAGQIESLTAKELAGAAKLAESAVHWITERSRETNIRTNVSLITLKVFCEHKLKEPTRD